MPEAVLKQIPTEMATAPLRRSWEKKITGRKTKSGHSFFAPLIIALHAPGILECLSISKAAKMTLLRETCPGMSFLPRAARRVRDKPEGVAARRRELFRVRAQAAGQ
jgi:hypothetical protein